MGQAIRGVRYEQYAELLAHIGGDMERMSASDVKHQLRNRLQLIELQIQMLTDRLSGQRGARSGRRVWAHQPLDDDAWTSLASLRYLAAARDALRRTISTL